MKWPPGKMNAWLVQRGPRPKIPTKNNSGDVESMVFGGCRPGGQNTLEKGSGKTLPGRVNLETTDFRRPNILQTTRWAERKMTFRKKALKCIFFIRDAPKVTFQFQKSYFD